MSKPVKKKLLCYIVGTALFEASFPILELLGKRGLIDVQIVVSTRLKKSDPEIVRLLERSSLDVKYQSRFQIEFLSYFSIKKADALFSERDPYAYPKRGTLRDTYLPASQTPQIFIQHGMLQSGINWPSGVLGLQWYSGLILWWDDYNPEESGFIERDIASRVKKIGYIKKRFDAQEDYSVEDKQTWASYRQRLLVCTNFKDQRARFGEGRQVEFYEMLDAFCLRNPDVLIILRPHRGRQHDRKGHDADRAFDARLIERHNNVVVMDSQNKAFAHSTIHNGLRLCDGIITHASTAVLDGIYAGVPTGVLDNKLPRLSTLPNIKELADLEAFSEAVPTIDPKNNKVFEIYGNMEANIKRAVKAVENFMLDQPDSG